MIACVLITICTSSSWLRRSMPQDAQRAAARKTVAAHPRDHGTAHAIKNAGIAVGYSFKFDGESVIGKRAALWGADAVAIDLNDLIDPASGWNLYEAGSISDTNWIGGYGGYDPDGIGPLPEYSRAFLMQVPRARS
jgi:hypothetical protein